MPSEADVDDIVEPEAPARKPLFTRRSLVAGAAALASVALTSKLLLGKTGQVRTAAGLRKLRLAWNANSICLSPALMAKEYGIYEKQGLDVELVNFAGSTDQLLEAISTGKADAGVGMIMRWIKPLEQGFDVKLIAGTHGGCARMVGAPTRNRCWEKPSVKAKSRRSRIRIPSCISCRRSRAATWSKS
jgi:NitT/TauT family transport system substrate-binding protein